MNKRKIRARSHTKSRVKRDAPKPRATRKREPAEPRPSAHAATRRSDPFLTREKSNYDEPVPSREMILRTLEAQGVPVSGVQLAQLLGITASEQEGF